MITLKNTRHILVGLLAILVSASTLSQPSLAAGTPGFEAGRIIDNSVMTNYGSMSVSQIQNFLNSKVPSCDTYGQKLSEYGGPDLNGDGKVQRWEWGKAKYNQTKFVCLRNYKVSDGRTAARVIYDVGRKYKINPQVLIVLLQKEQGLVTDTWPLNIQYRSATGYGCPDTAPCASQYYGLVNQLDWAAKMYRSILNRDPNWYSPYIAGYNPRVYWHPDTSRCGSRSLTIENWSTAALYSYTPYRPNQAALDAGYGTGNSCSSYGNRNFYLYFKDWFGNTRGKELVISENLKISPATIVEGMTASTSFVIKNYSSQSITIDGMTVAVRDSKNNNFNFPSEENITIGPGSEYKYYQKRVLPSAGKYKLWIATKTPYGEWSRDWPKSNTSNIIRERTVTVEPMPAVSVTKNLSTSPNNNLSTVDTVEAKFEIKNEDSRSATISEMVVAARDGDGKAVNFSSVSDITLQPGQTYNYSKKRQFSNAGSYRLWIAIRDPSGAWSRVWPESSTESIVREINTTINDIPDLSVTRYLRYSPSPALAGEQTGVSFTVKNNEASSVTVPALRVLAQDKKGAKLTFPIASDISLAAGEEHQYYTHRSFTDPGDYTISIQAQLPSGAWSDNWLRPQEDWMRLERKITVKTPNVSLERILKYSPVPPRVGTTVGASFLLRNNEDRPVTISEMTVAGRDKNGAAANFPSLASITIQPGQTYEYYRFRQFTTSGTYNIWIAVRKADGTWSRTWPYNSDSGMTRDRSFIVNP